MMDGGKQMTDKIEAKLGDALDLFKEISDESIDIIIADPPYNLGKDYGNNNDNREFDEYH
jgi:Predicted archaeal methyltransferase